MAKREFFFYFGKKAKEKAHKLKAVAKKKTTTNVCSCVSFWLNAALLQTAASSCQLLCLFSSFSPNCWQNANWKGLKWMSYTHRRVKMHLRTAWKWKHFPAAVRVWRTLKITLERSFFINVLLICFFFLLQLNTDTELHVLPWSESLECVTAVTQHG